MKVVRKSHTDVFMDENKQLYIPYPAHHLAYLRIIYKTRLIKVQGMG